MKREIDTIQLVNRRTTVINPMDWFFNTKRIEGREELFQVRHEGKIVLALYDGKNENGELKFRLHKVLREFNAVPTIIKKEDVISHIKL